MRLEGNRLRRIAPRVALVALAVISVGLSACGLDESAEQNLVGPADTILSIQLIANPDVINADGVSIAVVTLVVRDPNGAPVPDKAVEFWYSGGGDGELRPSADSTYVGPIQSAIIMATDGGGVARVIWVAGTSQGTVRIWVRPFGIDANRGFYREVEIRQQ
jgi:hypothetical protein